MVKAASMYEGVPLGGTLDIGAGDSPYSDATFAVDFIIPTKPTGEYNKGKIRVVVTPDAAAGPFPDMPLQVNRNSKLRLYYVGGADKLPREWAGAFSVVKARNSILVSADLYGIGEYKRVATEAYRVLKPGGILKVLANDHHDRDLHIKNVEKVLDLTGFVDIGHTVSGVEVHFSARRPLVDKRRKVRYSSGRRMVGRLGTVDTETSLSSAKREK